MTGPRSRRSNVATEEVEKMKQLEQQGMKRNQIAKELNLHPSCITRHLGSSRKVEETEPVTQ